MRWLAWGPHWSATLWGAGHLRCITQNSILDVSSCELQEASFPTSSLYFSLTRKTYKYLQLKGRKWFLDVWTLVWDKLTEGLNFNLRQTCQHCNYLVSIIRIKIHVPDHCSLDLYLTFPFLFHWYVYIWIVKTSGKLLCDIQLCSGFVTYLRNDPRYRQEDYPTVLYIGINAIGTWNDWNNFHGSILLLLVKHTEDKECWAHFWIMFRFFDHKTSPAG